MTDEVRFFTQADSRFFLGAAAMLESLRLSGNAAPAFVLDNGLQPDQRERLSALAEVLTLPSDVEDLHPRMMKATADLFWSSGVVVLLDSDMIITSRLDDLIEHGTAGRIAVHPDHNITKGRQFSEWADAFELRAPMRPQPYVNCTPMAISLDRWGHFFGRWRSACRRLPADWASQGFLGPFGLPAQDAMNALLMSEIPAEAIWIGSDDRTVHADALEQVEILDSRTVRCRYRGRSPVVLHYGLDPKAWERAGWRRIRPDDAYVRLLRRLLFGPGGRVDVKAREAPLWLKPSGVGHAAAWMLGVVNFVRVDLRRKAIVLRNGLFRRS